MSGTQTILAKRTHLAFSNGTNEAAGRRHARFWQNKPIGLGARARRQHLSLPKEERAGRPRSACALWQNKPNRPRNDRPGGQAGVRPRQKPVRAGRPRSGGSVLAEQTQSALGGEFDALVRPEAMVGPS
jgi:hypothetical protein